MNGKIIIRADLKVLTGLHIGASDAFSAIGAIDSPVIRDKRTQYPIVPGSSLKGKLRTLLVRSLQQKPGKPEDDPESIRHLFGTSTPEITYSRLQFADAFLKGAKAGALNPSSLTEAKYENSIDRETARPNPRQIERVVSGTVFDECITYNEENPQETMDDLKLLAKGMKLLQIDYLGGHGTRGSGRVSFERFRVETVDSDVDRQAVLALFQEVESYELLPV